MRSAPCLVGLFAVTRFGMVVAADSPVVHVVGHYSDKQLEETHILQLPRTFLYDAKNQLVPDDQWPAELADVRNHRGKGDCCLSYDKNPNPSGPPEACAKTVYETEVGANFVGLIDVKGAPIGMQNIPPHKWLLVEYGASWCTPCVVEQKLLKQLFASARNPSEYAWVTIDMTRLIEVKDSAKKAKSEPNG